MERASVISGPSNGFLFMASLTSRYSGFLVPPPSAVPAAAKENQHNNYDQQPIIGLTACACAASRERATSST